MSLIRDFLISLNMQFTLAVFDPETCEGVSYKKRTRTDLACDLGLENVSPEVPLLHALVTNIMKEYGSKTTLETKPEKPTPDLMEHMKEKLVNLKGNNLASLCPNSGQISS